MKPLVLVVDDDEDIRETFEMILRHAGYGVVTASNGQAALEVLRTRGNEIGLILLDVLMPNMNGWQFLEERSKHNELEDVPTIILSAAHPTNPMSAHASAFLAKPVGMHDLLSAVRTHLNFDPHVGTRP
jgi:CheY-like chemotaxis protein